MTNQILDIVNSFADIEICAKHKHLWYQLEPSNTSEDVAHYGSQSASSSTVAQSGRTFK